MWFIVILALVNTACFGDLVLVASDLGQCCGNVLATTRHWFRVRLCVGGLKIAIEIHKYAMYKNQMDSHKCNLVGNTNINWGDMACFHCIIMLYAQLKLGAQKYEFIIRTSNSESMLSGPGDVRREFMCSERFKDEVEQLLQLSFSMFNQLLHFTQFICVFGSSDPGYYFRFPLQRSRSIRS